MSNVYESLAELIITRYFNTDRFVTAKLVVFGESQPISFVGMSIDKLIDFINYFTSAGDSYLYKNNKLTKFKIN